MKYIKRYESNFFGKRILDVHGWGSAPDSCFHPWLNKTLTEMGFIVDCPRLPNTDHPVVDDQVEYVLENYGGNKYDIILGHSLGGCVSMKLIPKLNYRIGKFILLASALKLTPDQFPKEQEIVETMCDWNFNIPKIKSMCDKIIIVKPVVDTIISADQTWQLSQAFGEKINYIRSNENHVQGDEEPQILRFII